MAFFKTLFDVTKTVASVALDVTKTVATVALKQAERRTGEWSKNEDITDEQREKASDLHTRIKNSNDKRRDSRISEIDAQIKRIGKEKTTDANIGQTREEIKSLENEKSSLKSEKRWSS
jgi:Spy/CpxP family protein refolding chaperone